MGYDRKIACSKGTLITVYDPKAAKGAESYWKQRNITQYVEHSVPAGYEVEVIDSWVKLAKSAAS